MKCRHCGTEASVPFIDLGSAPPSNAYLTADALNAPEKWFPLRVVVCPECWLVQTEDYTHHAELFDADYAYFSSFSTSWLQHAEQYVNRMTQRFRLNQQSHVVEVAANDGYLLQYVKQQGIPCLGIEPTHSTAEAARAKGIEIAEVFFGETEAKRLREIGKAADLMAANNVLAHVPDINDFVKGFAILLKPHGVATFEFPHLLNLVQQAQFDTIYHEHFSYLSLTAAQRVFEANGLTVFDVETLKTHGGSLRVFAQRSDVQQHKTTDAVSSMLQVEQLAGINSKAFYEGFQQRAEQIKFDLLQFLLTAKQQGKTVAAYGAAAKGNTLLNFAGIRGDLIQFVVDRNPAKQNKYMPGSRIPIVDEAYLKEAKPDYVVVLPWNLEKEIAMQLAYVKRWSGKLAVAIPNIQICTV